MTFGTIFISILLYHYLLNSLFWKQIGRKIDRHYKATMEYHNTKDILHVMQILGHRSINNTLVYTHLINFKDDDFTAKVAHSEQEVCQLAEAGFEFVCDYDGSKIFRKRK
jgi:hypothetical protein